MSRRRDTELAFGSDSFLDVLANIVGILIVLIVVVGVRVAKAPVNLSSPKAAALPDPEPDEEEDPSDMSPESDVPAIAPIAVDDTPDPEPPSMNEPLPLPELAPPKHLVKQVQDLESELKSLNMNYTNLDTALKRDGQMQSELERRLQTTQGLFEQRNNELKDLQAKDVELKHDLALARQTVARLKTQIKEEELKGAPVETLEHRITPISRVVRGQELHFRLDKNRVAEVPLEALVERLKEHIERRQEWLAKTKHHKGLVGPIAGFSMEYIVGVETINGIGMGRTDYHPVIRSFEVIPEKNLRGETEEEALAEGSRFYQCLLGADPATTLTFWVYPDSFPIYRKLQHFAHEHGFPVAARPLPNGVPISGNPHGSRSAAQ